MRSMPVPCWRNSDSPETRRCDRRRSCRPASAREAGLALLQARGINCLVLDEPTNHLDIEAVEQLEQALGSFTGTLLLVTHDRRLAEAIAVDTVIDVATISRERGKVAATATTEPK